MFKTTLIALLFVVVCPLSVRAQSGRELPEIWQIGHGASRSVMSLNGEWDVIVDPYDTGSVDYKSRPLGNGFWTDRTRSGPLDLVEYNFDESEILEVPGDWNTQQDELFFYEGTVWYRHLFEVREIESDRRFIRLAGANRRSTVWLNGQLLGSNPVGFTPKSYEVTGLLRKGANSLVVRVDNRRSPSGVPGLRTDWWNYGGITRRVDLLAVPTTFVRDAHAELAPGLQRINGWVALDGTESASRRVRISVGGQVVEAMTNASGVAAWSLDRGGAWALVAWDPRTSRVPGRTAGGG